jgi:hypothetical protein
MILKALLLKNVPNDPESNLAWMILKALLLKNVPNDPTLQPSLVLLL